MIRLEKEPPWIVKDIRFNQQTAWDVGCIDPHDAPLRPLVRLSCADGPDRRNPEVPSSGFEVPKTSNFGPRNPRLSRSANPTPGSRDRRSQEDQGTIAQADQSTASRPACSRGSAHSPDGPR